MPERSDAELRQVADALVGAADRCAAALPAVARSGVARALATSAERVLASHASGRLDQAEASKSLEMLREMLEALEALEDLQTGRAEITEAHAFDANVRQWRMRAPDGDEFLVTSRLRQDERGEARVGFSHIIDDGRALPKRNRMSIRVDLERRGSPSVDVQFGSAGLDKRVLLLLREPAGLHLALVAAASVVSMAVLSIDLAGSTPTYPSSINSLRNHPELELLEDACTGRADCVLVCPTGTIEMDGPRRKVKIAHAERCIVCGACIVQCPEDALQLRYPDGRVVAPATIRRTRLSMLGRRTVEVR